MNQNVNVTKILRIALLAALSLIFLAALITGANIFFFWSIFDWFYGVIIHTTGIDNQLAKAFAALIMAALMLLPIGRLGRAFMPIPQKYKNLYRSLAFIGLAIFFLFLYFGGQDTYFDRQTGKALKYYSISPVGTYKFFSEPGFNPETGDTLKAVTKEVILKSKGLSQIAEPMTYANLEPTYNHSYTQAEVQPVSQPIPETSVRKSEDPPSEYRQPEPKEPDYSVPKQVNPSINKAPSYESSRDSKITTTSISGGPNYHSGPLTGSGGSYADEVGLTLGRSFKVDASGVDLSVAVTVDGAKRPLIDQNPQIMSGELFINNTTTNTIWIQNSALEYVFTIKPKQVIKTKILAGDYFFHLDNSSLYWKFYVYRQDVLNIKFAVDPDSK